MPGEKLAHALEERLACQAELKGEIVLEAVEISFDPGHEGQERLHLGGQVENAVHYRVVERLDAEPVAGADEALPGFVPQREGEHAPEMVHALVAPLPVRAEDH